MTNVPTEAPEKQEPIVLIIPVGVQPPQDFPIRIVPFSTEQTLVEQFTDSLLGEAPVVHEMPADFATVAIQLARYLDVELRVLVGFTGDYPSYWNASTSVLPVAVSTEIMIARDEAEALGGDGVPDSKKPRDEMKPADQQGIERRLAMLASIDGVAKVAAKTADAVDPAEEDLPTNTED